MACPLNRFTRPSRCSESMGLAGVFQCVMADHRQWKSIPSCLTLVFANTNCQNGLLRQCPVGWWTSDRREPRV